MDSHRHIAFAIWRIRAWRIRRRTAASSLVDKVSPQSNSPFSQEKRVDLIASLDDLEKPTKAVLLPAVPPTPAPGTGWVPQIRSIGVTHVAVPEPAIKPASRSWEKSFAKLSGEQTPPPAYIIANGASDDFSPRPTSSPLSSPPSSLRKKSRHIPSPLQTPINTPLPPLPEARPTVPPTPPTPPASKKLDNLLPKSPARTSSFAPYDMAQNRTSTSPQKSDKKLPRMMSVSTTFTPTLEDELSVELGETVRLIEEYEDSWCLVQRVGRIDAPKGVVPRLCLQERAEVVPGFRQSRSGRISRR